MFSHKVYLKLGEDTGMNIQSLLKNDYEVANFEFSFQQGIDEKGKVSTDVFGGNISLILPMLPSDEIMDWALNSYRYKNGMVITLDAHDNPISKLFFKNGKCTGMFMNYSQKGKSYIATNITIQAEEIIMGYGVDFISPWVK